MCEGWVGLVRSQTVEDLRLQKSQQIFEPAVDELKDINICESHRRLRVDIGWHVRVCVHSVRSLTRVPC